MRVRPYTDDGDMIPIHSLDQMLEGNQAVAQNIEMSLGLLHGEWWEDETLGFQIPEFLAETSRQEDLELLSRYISTYVGSSEGVTGISEAEVEYYDHAMTYRCIVTTGESSEEVEVNLNGVL